MSALRPVRLSAGSGPTFGVDDIACAAASHLGLWEEEGLAVSWAPAKGGLAAMRMALAGEVDAAYGGLGPVLRLRAEGEPVRIFASMARALAQNLVARPTVPAVEALRGASWAVDGIGALSHHMARSIVAALGMSDDDVDWRVVGPPPERIAALLAGEVDAALLRVEEALALTADPANDLSLLLGFAELKELVPVQPHGVLATTERFEAEAPDVVGALTRGIVRASRRLHDDFDAFLGAYERHVTVRLPAEEVERIWRQERGSDGFALDGEMTAPHWDQQIAAFAALHPELDRVARAEILADRHIGDALVALGASSA